MVNFCIEKAVFAFFGGPLHFVYGVKKNSVLK